MKFTDLNLITPIQRSLEEMGFEEPTPIQKQSIGLALEGKDLIGQAQTGTGKTAAFGLPMLNKLDSQDKNVQGLVIAPTRELAIQVQEEIFKLGKGQRAKVYPVFGGSPIGRQIERIKRNAPQIIVGTPGRILDLINRRVLKLDHLQTLVLDEADEMLNMGFIDDIRDIIKHTPDTRQTLLFSATMPPEIRRLADQFLKDPEHVKVKATVMTSDLIDQYYVKLRDNEKFDVLTRLLDVQAPKQAIVFARTKRRVDEIGRALNVRGFDVEVIHGDIPQQKRTQVIREFRKGSVELLVATDVAARGLDISGVTHVYNYDITQDPESYVHRIGRTGRAGKEGESITFVTPQEMDYLRTIEQLTRKQMSPLHPPTSQEAAQGQVQQLIDELNRTLSSKEVDSYKQTAQMLLEHYETTDLIAALLNQIITDNTQIEVSISPQRPLPQSRSRNNRRGGRRSNRHGGGHKRGGQGQQRRNRSSNRPQNKERNSHSSKGRSSKRAFKVHHKK